MTREEKLLEINKLMKNRKNRHMIYNEFIARGISISRAEVESEVEFIKEIKEYIEKGYKNTEILKELRKKGYKFRDSTAIKIINDRRRVVKHDVKKKKFLCIKYIEISHCGDDEYVRYILRRDIEMTHSEVYKLIEDYEFMYHSYYDDIVYEMYLSDKKEDEQYRLCINRLKSMYDTIFTECQCLRLDQIMDITDDIALEFMKYGKRGEIIYWEECLSFLRKVKEILIEKEIFDRSDFGI